MRRRKMKTLNKISISFAICILAVIASVGVANAGEVTVNYQVFPSGPTLDSNVITGCDTATANTYAGYDFLFWDNQGTLSWTSTVSICPGSGNTVATAWYLATGGGPCPPSGCYVTTYAFSIDHDEVLTPGTPIALVVPNSPIAWTGPPSNTVNTTVNTSEPESISALSSLAFPPYAAEPFRYWQQLNAPESPIGVVYQASENLPALVVAFYGPDPCQTDRNELQSCLEGAGESGPLKCGGFSKALIACEQKNREIQ
jgi:hypothetical protein